MSQGQAPPLFIIAVVSLFSLQLPVYASSSSSPPEALVSPIYKDSKTSLYTIPINNGKLLVLDLTNPLIWSICSSNHPTISCTSSTCATANQFSSQSCKNSKKLRDGEAKYSCNCTARPYNPISDQCGMGDLTLSVLTSNTTDGKNPLYPTNLTNAVVSCAPRNLLIKLPTGATGIAGLGSSDLTLPSQLSSLLNIERQFALCLPAVGTGVSFFGSGPFFLLTIIQPNITSLLRYVPLIKNPSRSSYYITMRGIAVNQQAVQLPQNAFAKGVTLSTVSSYTIVREDIYTIFLNAYATATKDYPRVKPIKPFDLCFDSTKLGSTRVGYAVPQIDLMFDGGKNWTVFGANSVAQVDTNTACFAFLPNQTEQKATMVVGGFQMENNFLLFDLKNSRLGYSGLLFGIMTTCNNFNFTYAN
ncbi:hypothetical protein LUZ60_003606 [Juncus effusus]|nr:hypothetical protein LUZ60_003606 [Juncus effusus]